VLSAENGGHQIASVDPVKQFLFCALFPAALLCQTAETDIGEIAAYAGGVAGIGSHPAGGITFMTALSKYTMFGAELGFASLGEEGYRTSSGSLLSRSRLYDFNGHVHVRIPVRDHFAPYIVIGAGLLHSTAERVVTAPTGNAVDSFTNNDFAFQIGAGLRYFITDNWGVRPEWKYYASERNFSKLSFGVFYQFP
jgi:opacity protein-like surface antigen